MGSISLVSVNIERSRHLERVSSFLKSHTADVVCLQELMEYDIPFFSEVIGAHYVFMPMAIQPAEGKQGVCGVGIFSRMPMKKYEARYYAGSVDNVILTDDTNDVTKHATENYGLLYADIRKGDEAFRIATTHFTWSPEGKPTDFQRGDMDALLAIAKTLEPVIIIGDFNAPRPGEIFAKIASVYKDNIPSHYLTSIDVNLHRNGNVRPRDFDDKMVDGLFTTPEYRASNVVLHQGVSDHCAITATIECT